MKTKFLILISLFLGISFFAGDALAQTCKRKVEQVVVLDNPEFKDLTTWNFDFKTQGAAEIIDVAIAPNEDPYAENTYIITGNYTDNKNSDVMRPFLAHVSREGKLLWENKDPGTLDKRVKRLLVTDEGYVVMGGIKNSRKWKGFYVEQFDKAGQLTSRTPVYGDQYQVIGTGMAPSVDGKAYIVSAQHEAVKEEDRDEAVLYRISKEGKMDWRRRYDAGMNMKFHNIQLMPSGLYAITGSMDHIKKPVTMGMLMMMNEEGTRGWQQQYERGDFTSVDKVITMANNDMLLIGGTLPKGDQLESGMIMKVNEEGSMIWRRFYTGRYRFTIEDIDTVLHDRIIALVGAHSDNQSGQKDLKEHIQIITLSSDGHLLGAESYKKGDESQAFRLLQGDKLEHVFVGWSKIKQEATESNEKAVQNGWLQAARLKNQSFEDLCAADK